MRRPAAKAKGDGRKSGLTQINLPPLKPRAHKKNLIYRTGARKFGDCDQNLAGNALCGPTAHSRHGCCGERTPETGLAGCETSLSAPKFPCSPNSWLQSLWPPKNSGWIPGNFCGPLFKGDINFARPFLEGSGRDASFTERPRQEESGSRVEGADRAQ